MRWLLFPLAALASLHSLSVSAQDTLQITKYRRLVQSSAAAPVAEAGNPYQFVFFGAGLGLAGTSVTLTPPSGTPINVPTVGTDSLFRASAPSAQALNAVYAPGTYTVEVGVAGLTFESSVTLGTDAYPPAPSLANFTAAQAIDATSDFLIDWSPFTGGTAEDFILLRVMDSGANTVFEDTLDGTSEDYLLPSETLAEGQTYSLELTFVAINDRGDTENFLPLSSAFASVTTLPVKTTGAGGGGDRIAPTLVFSLPATGQTLATALTPLLLTFSEPMDPLRTPVVWSALSNGVPIVLAPARFSYAWSGGGTILSCTYDVQGTGWPASTFVTWALQGSETGFRDVAGNPLNPTGGFFQTPDGCEDEDPAERAGFGLFKRVTHFQSSAAAPGLDTTNRPLFQGFVTLTNSGVRATVELPAAATPQPNRVVTLTGPTPGSSFLFETRPTEAELNAAFPGGQYEFQVRSAANNATIVSRVTLTFQSGGFPNIPRFSNFNAAQAINSSNAFTLSWDAFTGATALSDYLSLEIWDSEENTILSLPNPCQNQPLPVTATSATIPAGQLQPNATYLAVLSFVRLQDSNRSLDGSPATGITATGRSTRMLLRTLGGSTNTAPVLRDLFINASNQLDITVDATVGRPFTLERSSMLGGSFTPVTTTTPASSPFHLQVPLGEQGFFRGRTD